VPLCVMWCLWRERNPRNFEDRELGILELKKKGYSNTLLMESDVAFPASFNTCGFPKINARHIPDTLKLIYQIRTSKTYIISSYFEE
jgi:hypothetical protein